MPMKNDDQRLAALAARGDQDAFAQLVERYAGMVYSLALQRVGAHHDAEDIAQTVFFKAWKALPGYRGEAALSTWLYRLTSNVCIDHLRREKRQRTVPLTRLDDEDGERPLDLPDPDPGPEERAEQSERRAALRRAVAQLPEDQRAALLLRESGGLSYSEIAAALRVPEGTVKSRIARARLQLREILSRDGNFSR